MNTSYNIITLQKYYNPFVFLKPPVIRLNLIFMLSIWDIIINLERHCDYVGCHVNNYEH